MIKTLILDFLTNRLFLAAAGSWVAAQIIKLIIQLATHGETGRLLTGGGMPSSHTATMMGLVIETALVYGTAGFEFPMALFFMVMVVYDAMNVRYVTGEQNKILNRMIKEKIEEAEKAKQKEKLEYYRGLPHMKELLGHTLPEVLVGAVIGIIVAIIVWRLIP